MKPAVWQTWKILGLAILAAFLMPVPSGAENISDTAVDSRSISELSRISDAAERCVDSVVNISSTRIVTTRSRSLSPFFNDPFFRDFFGRDFFGTPREKREKSLGSGVIVSSDGLILTSSHVVEGASEIVVTLADKRELNAEIVGTDTRSDVAVVRLQGNPEDLQPIPLGDSTALRLGELVLAIGNPFGLSHTVTMGIISAKGRHDMGIVDYEDFIQTDAAINPGNSGGALINLRGELVGINTAILSSSGGYQGVGFAIPIQLARAVMNNLVRNGKVLQGWLGITVQDLDPVLSKALGLSDSDGILISGITPASSAEKAGLRRGQVIKKFNGQKITSADRFQDDIAAFGAGNTIELEVEGREGSRKVTLVLETIPDSRTEAETELSIDQGPLAGISLGPITESGRRKYYLPKNLSSGLLITAVKQGTAAASVGLEPGDVILEMDKKELSDPSVFLNQYRSIDPHELLLLVYRNGSTFYMVLRR